MLTPKQQRFVAEYLVDQNAKQAAIRAGYSAKTAETQGSRLFRNAQVRAAIEQAHQAQQKRTGVTADAVLHSILRIAGKAENVADWMAALRGQELLGKHLKLFVDRMEIGAADDLAAILDAARARAKAKP